MPDQAHTNKSRFNQGSRFKRPMDVVEATGIPATEKLSILKAWEEDEARCSARKMRAWLAVNMPICIASRRHSTGCGFPASRRASVQRSVESGVASPAQLGCAIENPLGAHRGNHLGMVAACLHHVPRRMSRGVGPGEWLRMAEDWSQHRGQAIAITFALSALSMHRPRFGASNKLARCASPIRTHPRLRPASLVHLQQLVSNVRAHPIKESYMGSDQRDEGSHQRGH
jgi:hypothetical protein